MKNKHKKKEVMGKAIRSGDRFCHEHGTGTVAFITDYPAGGTAAKILTLNVKHPDDHIKPSVIIINHQKYKIIRG